MDNLSRCVGLELGLLRRSGEPTMTGIAVRSISVVNTRSDMLPDRLSELVRGDRLPADPPEKGGCALLTCPVCRSEDVRRSYKKPLLDFFKRWRGLKRYRCRDCRKSFYRPLSPTDLPLKRRSRRRHRARFSGWSEVFRNKNRRRAFEAILFVSLLIVFYFALKMFTTV